MAENFKYSYKIDGKNAMISLGQKALGGQDALDFTSVLDELSNAGNVDNIVLDLSNLELINSSGLGMLVGGMTRLKKHNISLTVCSVPEKVMGLFEMTHLNKVFEIHPDCDSELK